MPDRTPIAGAAQAPTRYFARFVSELEWQDVDPIARAEARRHLLDSLGASIAGSLQPSVQLAVRTLSVLGSGGNIPVAGFRTRFDVSTAAYVAGMCSHGLEVDDGFNAGAVHPSSAIIPAALALGLWKSVSGPEFLKAIVAGYEVSCRVAAIGHPATTLRGFHNTGIVGPLGAAAACASLLKLDEAKVISALGIAGSSCAGLFSFADGGDVKRLHPAHAAREGMLAALLAADGFCGAPDVLEQKNGWFKAFTGNADIGERDLRTAGGNHPDSCFAISNTYIKPYPTCRHVQAAIEGVLGLMGQERLSGDDIARVDIGTYAIGERHAHIGWREQGEAQLSYPYIVAAAIVNGRIGLEEFSEEARSNPTTLSLTSKINVFVDDECDRGYPAGNPVKISITTRDGRRLDRRVDQARGGVAAPFSDAQVEEKFLGLAVPVVGEQAGRSATGIARDIESAASLKPLVDTLALGTEF